MMQNNYNKLVLRWGTFSFSAVLLSLCLLIAYFLPAEPVIENVQPYIAPVEEDPEPQFSFDGTLQEEHTVSLKTAASSYAQKKDEALTLYRASISRPAVEWFYAHITENSPISAVILEYADKNDIPVSLAFALAYTESRYKTTAINRNVNGTIDRGLFQLNSASFPRLTEADFFDPAVSAKHGLAHLKYCLTTGGNEISALAMYNAGGARVKNDNTPSKTLNYIADILNYRQTLDDLFREQVGAFFSEAVNPILASAR
jgi:soluble lytic murein transglycosylase-like protein